MQRQAEEKLNELTPDQRMQYAQLQDTSSRLEADVQQKQITYDKLCRQVAEGEQTLQSEPKKVRISGLHEQRQKISERLKELQAAANKPVLSEAEQREQLLQQVKDDKQHIAITQRNIEEVEKRISQAQRELDAFENGGGAVSTLSYKIVSASYEDLRFQSCVLTPILIRCNTS